MAKNTTNDPQRAAILEMLIQRKPFTYIAAQIGVTKGRVAGLAYRNRVWIEEQQYLRLKARHEAEQEKWQRENA